MRYCDVGLRDEQAVPIAPIEIDILSTRGLAIVLVIYIKNKEKKYQSLITEYQLFFYLCALMKKIFLFAFVLCLIACNKKQAIPEAMYFWKTNLSFTKSDKAFLKEHAVKKSMCAIVM